MKKTFARAALAAALLLAAGGAQSNDWYDFNGNSMAQKYAPDTQITPDNVKDLGVAWQVHTGTSPNAQPGQIPKTAWQSTPLFVNNTVYVPRPCTASSLSSPTPGG